MCVGIPMEVSEVFDSFCLCMDSSGTPIAIDTLLIPTPSPGDWVLTFLNTAREIISRERAGEVLNALQALSKANSGENFEHLFADLIDREPQLPAFLQPAGATAKNGKSS